MTRPCRAALLAILLSLPAALAATATDDGAGRGSEGDASGDPSADLARDLDRFVASAMADYGVPGAAVVVVHGDHTVVRPYGVRRAGDAAPVDLHTRFAVASVTKAMTADLVARAVDAGGLGWDEPVLAHLPEMRLANDRTTLRVTPRQLLAHAGGFPSFAGGLLNGAGYEQAEMLRRLRRFPLVAELGTEAHYSNPGLFLAGLAAARALGAESWVEAMERELLAPLGMRETDFRSGPIERGSNVAHPHLATSRGLRAYDSTEDTLPLGPASAVVTSAADLARWLEMRVGDGALDGRRFLSPEAMAELRRPVILEEPGMAELPPIREDSLFAYTPGWGAFDYAGHTVYEKGGARGGFRAVVVDVPTADLAIGVMANLGVTAFPEAVRAWVLQRLLAPHDRRDHQAEIRERQEDLDAIFAPVLDRPERDPSIVPALPLAAYAGRYDNPVYGTVTLAVGDDDLTWAIGPQAYGGEVFASGHDTFLLLHPADILALPEEAIFTVGADGVPLAFDTDSWGRFERLDE